MTAQTIQNKRKNRSVSSFLKKTYDILENSQNNHAIKWAQSGFGFIVVREQQFSKQILPKYFKHSNYSSFVRQLNMYNFHKIRQSNSQSHFYHQFFKKNNKSLLSEIKRKPQKKKRKNQEQSQDDHQNQHEIDPINDKSDVSMKNIINLNKQKSKNIFNTQSQSKIRSYKSRQKGGSCENTYHIFKSQKQNQQQCLDANFSCNKIYHINSHGQNYESNQRVSIQNILLSGLPQPQDDKLSINNEITDGFPRYPTKQIFYPSNHNIYPFPAFVKGVNGISQVNILF